MESGTQEPVSVLQKVTIAGGKREKKEENLHFRLSPTEIYSWNKIVEKEGLSSSNTIRFLIKEYPNLLRAKRICLKYDAMQQAIAEFEAEMKG